jgi:Na+-translocating ferredoxin:NAD+ oxidoreductase RnfG subunit
VGIIFLIRNQHRELAFSKHDASFLNNIRLRTVHKSLPQATSIGPLVESSETREIVSATGELVGSLLQTAPIGNSAIGYLGPTNLLIVISDEKKILNIQVVDSADTEEHVDAVKNSKTFLSSYNGLQWGFPDLWPEMDTVSGATLTSYAIKQAVRARAGSQINLSKFPDKVQSVELPPFYPGERDLIVERITGNSSLNFGSIYDRAKATVGFYLRTSPTMNSNSGYQGPTDTLIVFDERFRFLGSSIRSSYDNEDYVQYVKEDTYLDELLKGKNLEELSALTEAEYEGVSGATMTSLNVFTAIQTTAEHLHKHRKGVAGSGNWNWFASECLTALLCITGLCMSFAGINKRRSWRVGFQVMLIIYLGFIAGEILSQAVILGWAQNGLPLKNAPGMVFLCVSALFVPVISKHNTYCDSICPFGAIQQLAIKSKVKKVRITQRIRKVLKLIPAALLGIVLLVGCGYIDINLASIEPFDAFSFRIAGWLTISIAVVGLVVSLFVPMAYCRFGCPTGALLNFLRFNRRSYKVQLRDFIAIVMLVIAIVITI